MGIFPSREASSIKIRASGPYLQSATLLFLVVVLFMMVELLTRLRRLAFLLLIRCPAPVRPRLTLPDAVTLTLFFSPLWVFCLGIYCLSLKESINTVIYAICLHGSRSYRRFDKNFPKSSLFAPFGRRLLSLFLSPSRRQPG